MVISVLKSQVHPYRESAVDSAQRLGVSIFPITEADDARIPDRGVQPQGGYADTVQERFRDMISKGNVFQPDEGAVIVK